jgi:transposase
VAELTESELRELVASQAAQIEKLTATIVELTAKIAELERRLGADSTNSSRPPSSDSPFTKRPAKQRSSRTRSGRKPGKQNGDPGVSRSLSDSPDQVVVITPDRCRGCAVPLAGAGSTVQERRQVVDLPPVPAPFVTEYQRVSVTCPCCGEVTTSSWADTPVADPNTAVVAAPGSAVRIGPRALAMCTLLTCAHYLPIGRATALLRTAAGIDVSTGFVGRVRRRAAARLLGTFTPYMQKLLATAPVLHADETTGRAAGTLAYVHVACTEYLTLMHVGGRSKEDIDKGGVLTEFTGVLVRDGYAGYDHLPAIHAWCGAHLLRDLRSVSDADPDGQLWAIAMADTLTAAHRAACKARNQGLDRLDEATLTALNNHYRGALAKGTTDNHHHRGELADKARTLIRRFRRYQDMILRFSTDLAIPWTNNQAERDARPVKIQQRNGGGCWRTLQGLVEFALVHSYLNTATKWGKDKYQALLELFTTGPWLPPALAPS